MSETEAIVAFEAKYGHAPEHKVFAPGRVNLIGEHTDYNNGFVLPFALPFRTVMVGSRSPPGEGSEVTSLNIGVNLTHSFSVSSMEKGEPTWANYVKGTVAQYKSFLDDGFEFRAVIVSDVPMGSGLSSSASMEVAVATFLEQLFPVSATGGKDKALRCQKAEHTWADTPCGIMDQYISANGQAGSLLLIDCASNEFETVPFGVQGDKSPIVLVINSNVKHTLSGSEYPDRVKQCKECVHAINDKGHSVASLREASMEMLEDIKTTVSDVVYRRGKHVIGEDKRTLGTVEALRASQFAAVGRFMVESHTSLRDDYEVSCKELDVLVEIALQQPHVLGSRMTGGGFGGCTVSLVSADADLEAVKQNISAAYKEKCGTDCIIYVATPSAGAGLLA
jgi:galactokinase